MNNLAEKNAQLVTENAALQQQLTNILKSAGIEADTVHAGVMELVGRMKQVVAENLLLKEACGGNGSYRDCPGCTHSEYFEAPEAPATDAYLNAVRAEGRAEGVEMLAEHHLWKAEVFANAGDVINSKSRIKMYNITEDFAAQLRAGNAGKDGSHE